ncbi:hypothetical protein ZWY2020_018534 [Hordeum vulgare]|nr:hypothetical protein ZWY2020_018534 [Hordeum vulgare]
MAAPASPGEDMDVEVAAFLASCAASEYGAAEALLDRLDARFVHQTAPPRSRAPPPRGSRRRTGLPPPRLQLPHHPRRPAPTTTSLEQALMLGCVGADVTASSRKSSWVNLTSQDTERPDLANARVVVTGGGGLKSAENFKLLAQQWVRPELPSMQDMCRMNFKSEPHDMSDVGLEHDAYHVKEMTPEQLITKEKLSMILNVADMRL